ncbi:MAG: hypothetical protein HY319_05365 [Armatimonadetes bacterium]|nr:hypothetical protein [Armatimonadota bacterium]
MRHKGPWLAAVFLLLATAAFAEALKWTPQNGMLTHIVKGVAGTVLVQPRQVALVVEPGRIDRLGPGRHTLAAGGKDILFVSLGTFSDVPWSTQIKGITLSGVVSGRIADEGLFLRTMVGSNLEVSERDLGESVASFVRAEIDRRTEDAEPLSPQKARDRMPSKAHFTKYGLTLTALRLVSVR